MLLESSRTGSDERSQFDAATRRSRPSSVQSVRSVVHPSALPRRSRPTTSRVGNRPVPGDEKVENEGHSPRIGLDFHRRVGETHRNILFSIGLCPVGCTHPTSEWDADERSHFTRTQLVLHQGSECGRGGIGPSKRSQFPPGVIRGSAGGFSGEASTAGRSGRARRGRQIRRDREGLRDPSFRRTRYRSSDPIG
jgi:hypothetical protein